MIRLAQDFRETLQKFDVTPSMSCKAGKNFKGKLHSDVAVRFRSARGKLRAIFKSKVDKSK